jgi:8-oxo-dGTP pyrophosphatase MutT (NUDIX family)
MDLSVNIGDAKLKIRVAGVVSTPGGFIFEKSDQNYIFLIGGKIMINETSGGALIREIKEELGVPVRAKDLTLVSVIENLYGSTNNAKVHEICFIYKVGTIFKGTIPHGFVEVPKKDLDKFEIMPRPIIDILKGDLERLSHIVTK